MFLMLLTCVSNFIQIGCYLLFDQLTYFLYTTLNYKNLKLQYLFDNIVIDFLFSWNFISIKDIIKIRNLTIKILKFTLNIMI